MKRNQNDIVLGTHGENYGTWMSAPAFYMMGGVAVASLGLGVAAKFAWKKNVLSAIGFAGAGASAAMLGWMAWTRKQYQFGEGGVMDRIQQYIVNQIDWNGEGRLLEVGCGSGPLSIRCALTWPTADVFGIDNWGVMWDSCYSKEGCERNAELEGVAEQCTFQKGDAAKLDFADESFDVVISNLVYHNIPMADKQNLLRETLRVLKKGGVFVLQDSMNSYGNMDAFVRELLDDGYEEVRLIDAGTEIFGSDKKASLYFVGGLKALVGRK